MLATLMQISKKSSIYVYQKPVVIFYSHKDSMSVIFGRNELHIGYWLAKKLFFQKNNLNFNTNEKMFNFIFLTGVLILINNFILLLILKKNYTRYILSEILDLKRNTTMEISIKYLINIIFNKFCNLFVR